MVVPKDSVVDVLPGSYDTFLHVVFEGNEGYIYAHHAEINKTSCSGNTSLLPQSSVRNKVTVRKQDLCRNRLTAGMNILKINTDHHLAANYMKVKFGKA